MDCSACYVGNRGSEIYSYHPEGSEEESVSLFARCVCKMGNSYLYQREVCFVPQRGVSSGRNEVFPIKGHHNFLRSDPGLMFLFQHDTSRCSFEESKLWYRVPERIIWSRDAGLI